MKRLIAVGFVLVAACASPTEPQQPSVMRFTAVTTSASMGCAAADDCTFPLPSNFAVEVNASAGTVHTLQLPTVALTPTAFTMAAAGTSFEGRLRNGTWEWSFVVPHGSAVGTMTPR